MSTENVFEMSRICETNRARILFYFMRVVLDLPCKAA